MCVHVPSRDSNDCILCAELLSNRTEPGEPSELRRRDSEIDRLAAENAALIAERDSLVELLALANEEAQQLADAINGGNYNAEHERDKLANEILSLKEERDFLKEALDAAIKDARYFEAARNALKARIDGGFRVEAHRKLSFWYGPCFVCGNSSAKNATLILDEGVNL